MMFNELALLFKTTFLDVYESFEKYSKNENGRIIKPTQSFFFLKKLGFTPCKAEQPLRDMELQEMKHKKDYMIQKICLERSYS